MRILLLTPPMTQLNTPYPATCYLTGFLRHNGIDAVQSDPALDLVLKLFSREGVQAVAHELGLKPASAKKSRAVQFFLENQDDYIQKIEPVIHFLQGKDPSLALRIAGREFLPEGPRFQSISEGSSGDEADPLGWAFGSLGVQDRAKHLASLFIDDVADVLREGIDSKFALSRYGEKLAASVPTFQPLEDALNSPPTLVDQALFEVTSTLIERFKPEVVGLTAPFPGNVYGAFRIAQYIKRISPSVQVILGGGYVNTELRQLSEPRVFDYFDFITLDDGEKPLLCILDYLQGKCAKKNLLRTFIREENAVVFCNDPSIHDIPHSKTGMPTYDGLSLDRYLSIFEMLNPMQRIWSDGRWNKLTLAHGCYWRKCNFCDISLDYIGRYDPASADLIIDRIESLIRETGNRGFHFVDEAAPPAVLKALAQRLLERKIVISWWGNIRFDKVFTPELASLLARSGCVAVSGGLEVASNRLLKLMQKGVTVEQVARVTHALTEAGVMVHAYLMYGFPTQTEQETVDSLERVRQLFEEGCIQSAYWHRFSATAHSPIGLHPEKFGIQLKSNRPVSFARNDLDFVDPTDCDHDFLGQGLRRALYNFMHGAGLDLDVCVWFGQTKKSRFVVPATTVPSDLIRSALHIFPKNSQLNQRSSLN